MSKADLEEFYAMVAVGDTVELVGERNEETAQLFGNGQNPVMPATAQPVQTAKVEPPNPPTTITGTVEPVAMITGSL